MLAKHFVHQGMLLHTQCMYMTGRCMPQSLGAHLGMLDASLQKRAGVFSPHWVPTLLPHRSGQIKARRIRCALCARVGDPATAPRTRRPQPCSWLAAA